MQQNNTSPLPRGTDFNGRGLYNVTWSFRAGVAVRWLTSKTQVLEAVVMRNTTTNTAAKASKHTRIPLRTSFHQLHLNTTNVKRLSSTYILITTRCFDEHELWCTFSVSQTYGHYLHAHYVHVAND